MDQRRLWRAADRDLFTFTTTDLRELHIGLMSAFDQSAILTPALNADQVRAALRDVGWDEPVDDITLQRALTSLVGWGLLEATQDHGAVYTTAEEFERKNLQWSLTPRGEAGIGGLLHALESLSHAVGLQPAVLDAIADGLSDLADLLEAPAGPDTEGRIHIRLAEVEGHHISLLTSVRQFNGHLQRLLREEVVDAGVFDDVKRRTVAYLREYVDGVERPQYRLALAVRRLHDAGVATLFDRALSGANLAPVAGGDPSARWLEQRHQRWQALCSWFGPLDGSEPRVESLLGIARGAIVELLRVLERRWDNRRRSASVANDFRRLAGWFADAPGEAEAQRLFAAAFGLWPARHAHLVGTDGEARATSTEWARAEPVDVAPALRTTGTLGQRGRVRPVADPAQVRAWRQRQQAQALAAHEGLRASLETDGLVALSSFGRLPPGTFGELLALLSAGLEAPLADDGSRRALSIDGGVEIIILPELPGRTARLRSDEGILAGPDLRVSIVLAASTSAAAPDATVQAAVDG